MPLQKLQFRPGVNREATSYSNEGGWFDGDKVRFRSGFPTKIGGWQQISNSQFLGTARSLWVWADGDGSAGSLYYGVGTNLKYYIYSGGIYYDITPIIQTDTLTNAITATSGSSYITITDGTYSPSVGDYITISGASSLGGNLTATVLNQEFVVTSILSATQYQVNVGVTANASDTGNGGTITVQYYYPSGLDVFSIGTGWGAGSWSRGTWGSSYSAGIGEQLRLWSNDNFGFNLVIAPRGGPIFYWQDSLGVNTHAQSLSSVANSITELTDTSTFTSGANFITVTSANAPYIAAYMYITGTGLPAGTQVASTYVLGSTTVPITTTTTSASSGNYSFSYPGAFVPNATYQVITSAIQEFVITFGSNSYNPNNSNTPFDPMLVRWSDQANPYQWVPAITNQSGEYTLTNGSYIMGARATRQEILVWTDQAIYSMQYIGTPYVWGFQILMGNISVMSPNCMITINNITYWMGVDKFYMYTGTVQTLPCAIWQYVFDDINTEQAYQIFVGSNEAFNEVWWFYVSKSSGGTIIDKYIVYNYLEQVWYYGTMNRSAWIQSGTIQYPLAADYNSRLLYHELGNDDNSTQTTQPITAYIQSSDFDIGDGHNFAFVWRMLPDINFNGSTVNDPTVTIQLNARQDSGSAYQPAGVPTVASTQNYLTVPEYTVQQFTGQVYTRLRGRQMAFQIQSTGVGVAWQLGSPRIDVRPDGRR
jgi:hypothetical protein